MTKFCLLGVGLRLRMTIVHDSSWLSSVVFRVLTRWLRGLWGAGGA